jgi:Ca-activated chloride channel homolog
VARGARVARGFSLVFMALPLLPAGTIGAQPRLKSGTELVHVDVTVLDASGRIVTGLLADAFEVYEDGRRQDIAAFSDKPAPTSVVVLLDRSSSMDGERYGAALAAVDALGAALGTDDRWAIATFDSSTRLIVDWTPPSGQRPGGVPTEASMNGTRLFGAIPDVMRTLQSSPTRKRAIVLITDGNDNSLLGGGLKPRGLPGAADTKPRSHAAALAGDVDPHADEAAAIRALRTGEALLYAIGIDWPYQGPTPPASLYEPRNRAALETWRRVNIDALNRLSLPTGGAAFLVTTPEALVTGAVQVASEIHQQYTIGYIPPKPPDGKIHRIEVKTRDPQHRVRARTAYLAKRRD